MKKEEIAQVLRMAYKRLTESKQIPSNVNVANFLIHAATWDLQLRIDLYFAKQQQIEDVAKELFNFKSK